MDTVENKTPNGEKGRNGHFCLHFPTGQRSRQTVLASPGCLAALLCFSPGAGPAEDGHPPELRQVARQDRGVNWQIHF